MLSQNLTFSVSLVCSFDLLEFTFAKHTSFLPILLVSSMVLSHGIFHSSPNIDADTVVSNLTDDSAIASQKGSKNHGDGIHFNDDVLFLTMTNGDCRLIKMMPQPQVPSTYSGEKENNKGNPLPTKSGSSMRLSLGFTPLSKASNFLGKRIGKHHNKTTTADDVTAVISAAEYADFLY